MHLVCQCLPYKIGLSAGAANHEHRTSPTRFLTTVVNRGAIRSGPPSGCGPPGHRNLHRGRANMSASERLGEGAGEPGLVSVVIPSYNRAYIVGQAIESALQQTHRPVEVLVADDGSTDDTRRVVEGYGPPVRYFYQPNAGVSAARNLGLRHARGEFIALLDSDDRWLPWKV